MPTRPTIMLTVLLAISSEALGQAKQGPETVSARKRVPTSAQEIQKREPLWEVFKRIAQPLTRETLEENAKAVGGVSVHFKGSATIKEVGLTEGSEGEISGDGRTFVLFNPATPYQGDLSCYNTDGGLRWRRTMDFSNRTDLSRSRIRIQVSNDGKRIVLVQFADEDRSIIGIYDAEGNDILVGKEVGYPDMAPSGRYFFEGGTWGSPYAGYLRVYDSLLRPIDLAPEFFHPHDRSRYDYSYGSRIYDEDILIFLLGESEKGSRGLKDFLFFAYDLNKRQVLIKESLMFDENAPYYVSLDIAVLRGRRFAAIVVGMGTAMGKVSLFDVDLDTRKAEKTAVQELRSVALSNDGSQYMIYNPYTGAYNIVDPAKRQVLKKGTLKPGSVESFGETNGILQVKYYSRDILPFSSRLITYSANGRTEYELLGWFDDQLNHGLVPVVSDTNPDKADLLRTKLIKEINADTKEQK